MEATPSFAPLVVFLFLGSLCVVGLCVLLGILGAARSSKLIGLLGAGSALAVVVCYAVVLCIVSLTSKEKNLPQGDWKYFCEMDCHIAYSVSRFDEARVIVGPGESTSAQGHGFFVVVALKTWFDEKTISPHRGNSPLTPGPRTVILLDDSGQRYQRSSVGEAALARAAGPSTALGQSLRPGDAYITDLVFEIPVTTHAQRLLVSDPENDWLDWLIIGHENSFLHKKIYLDLRPSGIIMH